MACVTFYEVPCRRPSLPPLCSPILLLSRVHQQPKAGVGEERTKGEREEKRASSVKTEREINFSR